MNMTGGKGKGGEEGMEGDLLPRRRGRERREEMKRRVSPPNLKPNFAHGLLPVNSDGRKQVG